MKRFAALSVLTLLLAACGQPTQTLSPVVPSTQTHLVEVHFTGAGSNHPSSSLQWVGASPEMGKQGLSEVSGLAISYMGAETLTSSDGNTRYMQAHYRITNNSGNTLYNLGFVPVVISDTDGNAANNSTTPTLTGTPFKSVKHYDGTSAPLSTAQGLTPTNGRTFNPVNGTLDPVTTVSTYRSGLDTSGYDVADPAGLEITEVKNEGWKFQDSLANGASAIMTFSVSFPVPADRKLAPFSFTLMAAYTEGIPDAEYYGHDVTAGASIGNVHPKLILTSTGVPVVGWIDSNGDVRVNQWNGSTWTALGGVVSTATPYTSNTPDNPTLVRTSTDQVLAGYVYGSGVTEVKRFNGSSWELVGGELTTQNAVGALDVAVDSQDRPVVSYGELNSGFDLLVKRWNGSSWDSLGGNLRVNASSFASVNSVAVGSDDLPVVAWEEGVSGQSINLYVKKWNGTTWEQLGTHLDDTLTNATEDPEVAVGSDNLPVVAYTERASSTYSVYVKKWNGTAWVKLGGSALGSSSSYMYPRVVLNSLGNPLVVFEQDGLLVLKTWNGSSWGQQSGTTPFAGGGMGAPVVALNSSDEAIYGWKENGLIYVKK